MSQIVTVKTKIKDLNILKEALRQLGLKCEIQRWYYKNDPTRFENKLTTYLQNVPAFIEKKGDFYEINYVADGLTSNSHQVINKIIDQIKQKYAYLKLKNECKKRNLFFAEEKILEDNTIKIVIREY